MSGEITKECRKCGEVKALSEYSKNKRRKDGRHYYCKSCDKARVAKWAKENKDKVNARNRKWRAENKDKVNAMNRKWRKENREKMNAFNRKWKKNNREKVRAMKRQWGKENRAKATAMHKKWREKNRDKTREAVKRWRNKNPTKARELKTRWKKMNKSKVTAQTARYRARKLQAAIEITKEEKKQIEQIYARCERLNKTTNIKWNVDHIIPLQGANICGLHVPWNLQVIPAKENTSKSNKFESFILDAV